MTVARRRRSEVLPETGPRALPWTSRVVDRRSRGAVDDGSRAGSRTARPAELETDRTKTVFLSGVAVMGAVGYAIAAALAKAAVYAEVVEEDQYCHPAGVTAPWPPDPVRRG